MPEDVKKKIEVVTRMFDQIINDRTVPRNIKSAVGEAKSYVHDESIKDLEEKISSAISILDEIINDPNMPMYTRTQIWNIVSMLESLRSRSKH